MTRNTIPLRVTQEPGQTPVVFLAVDGLKIEYKDHELAGPEITLRFVPQGVELDFDVMLLQRLLSEARTGEPA